MTTQQRATEGISLRGEISHEVRLGTSRKSRSRPGTSVHWGEAVQGDSALEMTRLTRSSHSADRYSMISSAIEDRPGGTLRPNAFAVFRLITNSNLVDWTAGRSAGLAPLRMRPAKTPAWRYASTKLVP